MSLSNTFENDLAKLIFQGTAIANIADNASSSPLTAYYISLHTSDPGEAGDQTTNETSYGSYARQPVNRNSGGFTVTNNVVTLTALLSFPACTSGSGTITHMGIGTLVSGTGKLLMSGAISPTIPFSSGVTPQLTTGTTITFD